MSKKYNIAVCLHGIADEKKQHGKKFVETGVFVGWETILFSLGLQNNIDVFVHSWSTQNKEKIEKIYKPASYLFQNQILFDKRYASLKEYNSFNHHRHNKKLWAPQRIMSHLYSVAKSLELKKKHEKEKNFTYDYVFVVRFDMHFAGIVNYDLFQSGNIYYSWPGPIQDSNTNPHKQVSWKYKRMGKKIWDWFWLSDSKTIHLLENSFYEYRENMEKINSNKRINLNRFQGVKNTKTAYENYYLKSIHSWYDEYFSQYTSLTKHNLIMLKDNPLSILTKTLTDQEKIFIHKKIQTWKKELIK